LIYSNTISKSKNIHNNDNNLYLKIDENTIEYSHEYNHVLDKMKRLCDWTYFDYDDVDQFQSNCKEQSIRNQIALDLISERQYYGACWLTKREIVKAGILYMSNNYSNNSKFRLLQDTIQQSLHRYQLYTNKQLKAQNNKNDNDHNYHSSPTFIKPYCVFDLIKKIAIDNEYLKLENIMNSIKSTNFLPSLVLFVIANYSFSILAKITNFGFAHFAYMAIMPDQTSFENCWFHKKYFQHNNNKEIRGISSWEDLIIEETGEIVHIWEPCHNDPRYVAEKPEGTCDVLLYFKKYNVYIPTSSDGVSLMNIQIPKNIQNLLEAKENSNALKIKSQ